MATAFFAACAGHFQNVHPDLGHYSNTRPSRVQSFELCGYIGDIVGYLQALFVAKHEVKSWPVFGWFSKMGGTLFVDRERRTSVGETTNEIQSALDQGALVVLFPEGTSSDGKTVLPFKSSLLEPATRQSNPLFAGSINMNSRMVTWAKRFVTGKT